jgi:hypothetical protein
MGSQSQNYFIRPLKARCSSLVFLIIAMIGSGTIQAQNELYIQAGGSILVSGNDGVNPTLYVAGATNVAGAGATLTNTGGVLQITGDIANGGTIISTGTEKFSGVSNQTISGTFSGSSYLGDVVKQNTGNIILSNNTDVNSLTFSSDGKIDASSGTMLYVKNNTYTSISGQSSLSYVDVGTTGSLKRAMNDITSGHYYAFPMGNSTAGYKRLDINLTSLAATGAGTATGSLKNGTPGTVSFSKRYSTGFAGSSGGPCASGTNAQLVEFTSMSNNYWSFTGPTDWTQNVLAYTGTSAGAKERRVLQSSVGAAAWTTGIEASIVGTVTTSLCANTDWTNGASTTVPGGTYRGMNSDFAIGTGSSTALPVTLMYLTATPVANSFIKLDWATASEINNKGFEIERSTDGVAFETIGWMDGHGNSNQQIDYSYNDKTVAPNSVYYYRLKQVDEDGVFAYSNIVSGAIIGTNGFAVESLRPNPANNKVTVQVVSLADQNATISVTDMLGREVSTQAWLISEGFNGTDIDLTALAAGTYNVVVKSQNQYFTTKLVVSR